ncbi:ribonuclease HI family protein [Patescibacteria group bacterium]|nr:ribonuclease HI family protein [Patescibacteria group bacterium]MCL5797198.1 ribonuclease HI family protein [Patescibacteria group bacterium]
MDSILINTDGGARGNPGPSAIGVVIKTENGQVLAELSRNIGQTTNNVAEYAAVIEALKWLKSDKATKGQSDQIEIHFFLDSTLVVNQLNGLFKVKEAHLRELMFQVRRLEQEVKGNISYAYIPREKNQRADYLVNKALDSRD